MSETYEKSGAGRRCGRIALATLMPVSNRQWTICGCAFPTLRRKSLLLSDSLKAKVRFRDSDHSGR